MAPHLRFIPHPKTAAIVGLPFGGGQRHRGVEHAPSRLVEGAQLIHDLERLGWKVDFCGPQQFEELNPAHDPSVGVMKNIHHPRLVSRVTHSVSKVVGNLAAKGALTVNIGGDQSLAIGTISSTLSKYPDACVIYVDAHADIHTAETTTTGDIHRMPLSFLLGLSPGVEEFSWIKPLLKPERLVYIGLRHIGAEEKNILKDNNIKVFDMHEVRHHGIGRVVERALDHVNPGRYRPIHLSFDIAALDPSVAPATGIPVHEGLTFREGHYICEAINKTGLLVAMDLMEINPQLAEEGSAGAQQTVEVGRSLIRAALGESVLIRRGL